MATSMHHAILAGSVRETSRFPNGKRIHIGTKSNPTIVTALTMNDAHDTRASDTGLYLVNTKGTEFLGDFRGCTLFFETKFWMRM